MNRSIMNRRRRYRRGSVVQPFLTGFAGTTVVALALGFVVGIFTGPDTDELEVSAQIDKLFASLDNKTFGDTYKTLTCPAFRDRYRLEDYLFVGERITERFGSLRSKELSKFDVVLQQGATRALARYDASFSQGSAIIVARFQSVGEKWLLLELSVEPRESAL